MWIGLLLVLLVLASVGVFVTLPPVGALVLVLLLTAWLCLTQRGRQALAVAGVGLRTLPQRLSASAVIVIGIAGVVGVLLALLAMAEGYSRTLRKSGSADTAIVLRGASASEVNSVLANDSLVQIEQAPQIARDSRGEPLASSEIVVAANLPLAGAKTDDDEGSVQLRGVSDKAFLVRPQIRLLSGRRFQPGLRELIVGTGAVRQFEGLAPGLEVKLGSQTWTVVGVFASGDAMESEVWGDASVVADTYRSGNSRNSVTVKLTNPGAFADFKRELEANPQLQVDISTTLDYFAKRSETTTQMIQAIGVVVGVIMAIGALFGALNTMYAAVAARAREIGTLRAIGFGGMPVAVAVILETMILALFGGLLGSYVAWVLFDGQSASTLTAGEVGKLSFGLTVTPALVWIGLKWALAIGFIGGLFPAARAARMPVAATLREL